ncbi:hypothetical protein FOZ61_008865 [Perkinsus olseni]|uniref:TRUD domain-containing protein n=1 Tax=Perkinsus olseni TaxID=32597 RepID=A0A7J6KTG9_PEROL|nr:hypothetical protein FOL46_000852 [Perkinsus olseni]KAF4653618.1 hypothetical protein FOZ61_008865 [Perkinsus olseni]
MAFDEGYELGDMSAAPFLERHCGAHAVSEVQKFLDRAALKKSTRNARGLLCRFPRVDGDDDLETVHKIRGALAWTIRKTLAVIPMKILSHEVLFYAAAEASRNKCLLDTMPREKAIELMRFVLRGFSDGGTTIRLNRGSNAEVFRQKLITHFENLEVSTMKETTVGGLFFSQLVYDTTGNPRRATNTRGADDISAGPREKCEVDNFVVNTGPSKLREGLSLGNCFRVRIRGAKRGVVEALSSFESSDSIIYYGLQRFGINPNHEVTRHCNIDIGGAIISGQYKKALRLIMSPVSSDRTAAAGVVRQWSQDTTEPLIVLKKSTNARIWANILLQFAKNRGSDRYRVALRGGIPRNVLLLYLSAYQSYLWNQLASDRICRGGLSVMPGDLVLRDGSNEPQQVGTNDSKAGCVEGV